MSEYNNKNSRRTMKPKYIFKTLAFAMLLTTACSSGDDDTAINTVNTVTQGYTLPVSVNVTRETDMSDTRATYNESGRKLEFSAGDKLFVKGTSSAAGRFAGTLEWESDGTFSGTITTEYAWTGTAQALLSAAGTAAHATLLPAGYESIGFLAIDNKSTAAVYDDAVSIHPDKAFATSKAAAVAQFSYENAAEYSSGFALTPQYAILNFTITGLTASISFGVRFTSVAVKGGVSADGSGTATFAIGVPGGTIFNDWTLIVGNTPITLGGSDSKSLVAGKIYNVTRNTASARALAAATTADVGKIAGADGYIYDTQAAATAAGTTPVAMIAYVGNESDCTHGLAIALADEYNETVSYSAAEASCNHKTAPTGCRWRLPYVSDWQWMFIGCGSTDRFNEDLISSFAMDYSGLKSKLGTAGGTALNTIAAYWSVMGYYANCWRVRFGYPTTDTAEFVLTNETKRNFIRACLAF